MSDADHAADEPKASANFPKQAVVVIHGMGEQVPMDTIKDFVRAVWETDYDITNNGMPEPREVWSKPDDRTGSLELRRITTRQSTATKTFPANPTVPGSGGVRTDFYELYWADLSAGSTMAQVENWIFGLLLRNPITNVPPKVRSAWVFLWILSILVVYLLLAPAIAPDGHIWNFYPYAWMKGWQKWIAPAVGAALAWIGHRYLVPYIGRVVRYTRAQPENIAARTEIRARGLELLDALHEGEYERIIVVGHSLGSILGYDLISYFWAMRLASHTASESSSEFDVWRNVEAALAAYEVSESDCDLEAFRDAQRKLCRMLRKRSKPVPAGGTNGGSVKAPPDPRWLITDFVTLGSPLTHASFLLASDLASFEDRVKTRDYPVAPPVREILDPKFLEPAQKAGLPLSPANQPALLSFKFPPDNWQMHHAAPFAATRWTNIYDPARFIFCGDLISGPLKPYFGKAIVDINLAELRGQSRRFTHTKYWDIGAKSLTEKEKPPIHIVRLREALNLAGQEKGANGQEMEI